jgi:transposase
VLDIREIVRRLQAGDGDRRIARDMQISRKTVTKYRAWATSVGLHTGPLPDAATLQAQLAETLPVVPPPKVESSAAGFRELVIAWRRQGVECRAIHQLLQEQQGFTGSYAAVYRFVRALEPRTPETCVRIETAPGDVGQVDFGYAGRLHDATDGVEKRAWVFVMTLGYSRHSYAEVVFDQSVSTWLRCHRHAFEWFGGVPTRLIIDNAKCAVVKAVFHDPVIQRAYRDCAEHYGFLIAPCRVRTPEHKGKVEQGGVHYVVRNALAGRVFRDDVEGNAHLRRWLVDTAGVRIHGTTKEPPLTRFREVEQAALRPLPDAPYTAPVWKHATLHRDCHVIFEEAFYSAPHRFCGERLWVRGADSTVTIFRDYRVVAVHPRATKPGERRTIADHLPPTKLASLQVTPVSCRAQAEQIGAATLDVVERLLDERPIDRLRTAHAILKLTRKVAAHRLEAACARALAFDDVGYTTIKRILDRGLDRVPIPSAAAAILPTSTATLRFARPASDFFPVEA